MRHSPRRAGQRDRSQPREEQPQQVAIDVVEDRNLRALARSIPSLPTAEAERIRTRTPIHVHVDIPNDDAGKQDRAVQLEVVLDLLPRMFRAVSVTGADPMQVFAKYPSHAQLIKTRQAGDPPPNVVIALTDADVRPQYRNARVVFSDNRGWTAYLSARAPCVLPRERPNPVGAYYAAVRACGEAFNAVFKPHLGRIMLVDEARTFDLVTLRANEPPNYEPRLDDATIELDDVAIVGVGAVGMAIVHVLGMLRDLRGRLRVIDPEATDATNEGRYPLAFAENRAHFKVLIAWNHLKDRFPLLDVLPGVPVPIQTKHEILAGAAFAPVHTRHQSQSLTFPIADYAEFQRVVGEGKPMRLVVATVDNAALRRDIQMGLHRIVLNGWTSTDAARFDYGISRHTIVGQNACCACLYHHPFDHPPGDTEFALGLTGWPADKVKRRLREEAHVKISPSELEALRQRLGVGPDQIARYAGLTLGQIVKRHCGVGAAPFDGRHGGAPVFHVPALAAAHLATEIILHALGRPPAITSAAQFDTLAPPTSDQAFPEGKRLRCLCQDDDVRQVYLATWGNAE